jgi:cytochrome c5
MRKLWITLAAVALVTVGVGVVGVFAENKPAPADEKHVPLTVPELEKLSGKDLYRATCKPCHGLNSKAGEYKPLTLIQEQWDKFFDEKYLETHKAVVDSTRNAKVTEWITPKMLEKIHKFAVDGAADSEHPMTCG